MNLRRFILGLALSIPTCALIIVIGGQMRAVKLAWAQEALPAPPINGFVPVLTVTASDVTYAGFGDVKSQAPAATAYLEPTNYFRVKETVTDTAWGGSANLLSVLIYPLPRGSDFTTDGRLVEKEYYSRYSACVTRTGYYVCVTGPDRPKVNALALFLSKK